MPSNGATWWRRWRFSIWDPDLAAKIPERLLFRLIKLRSPGALLWRLRNPKSMVKAAGGTTRPVEIPASWMEHLRRMAHRDFLGVMRAYSAYLGQRGLPDRLRGSGLPLLVIFGAEDQRWRASSVDAYRVVPGVSAEVLPGVGAYAAGGRPRDDGEAAAGVRRDRRAPSLIARTVAACDLLAPVRRPGTSSSRYEAVDWRGSRWPGSAIASRPKSTSG